MDKQSLEIEKLHLRSVLDKVNHALDVVTSNLATLGKENLEKLKDLRENPEASAADMHTFVEQLTQDNRAFNVKDKYKMLDELQSLIKEPYFARIDVANHDEDEPRQVYIGKFGYTSKEPVVTDWRAKIASVYYRYRFPQSNIKYNTPGGLVNADLLLKRTYEIDNGTLLKFFNNDLQLDESEIISDKIETRTGGVLEDIVETIQEGQLDIIETDPRKVTIVQGCVGSGKSTVAIHKLSHIFFNHPTLIKPERAILVAKNQILVGYLSTLFPKLGIFDINYKTLRELIFKIIFAEKLKVEFDLNKGQDLTDIDLAKIEELNSHVLEIHENTEAQINKLFEKEEYSSFGGYKYSMNSTPYQNISDVIADLEEELALQKEGYKENPKALKAIFYKDNIKIIRQIITKLKKIRIDISQKELNKVYKENNIDIERKLTYRESLIYLYFYIQVKGLENFRKYEYCVVDEGQDFGLLEYLILQKIIIHGRFCILGDLNQGIIENGISSWEDISEVITEAKSAEIFTLDTNYRSTKQIIDLANSILLPYTSKYLPKSINRMGSEPTVNKFNSNQEQLKHFEMAIREDVADLNKSIGIVMMDNRNFEAVKQILKSLSIPKERLIELDPDKSVSYLPKGVYFTKFENSKGLEFAKLYILDLDLDKVNDFASAKKAFVAVTRAMNELHISSTIE